MSSTTVNWERPMTTANVTSEATTRRVEVKGSTPRDNFSFTTEEEAISAFNQLQTENFEQLERILATS